LSNGTETETYLNKKTRETYWQMFTD